MNSIRKAAATFAIVLVLALTNVLTAGSANAAAFTRDAYPPNREGNSVVGWADLNRDCTGTYGCWNYIKIERKRWWGWEYVSGKWAQADGWNSVSSHLPPGCFEYRTVVDSYNDQVVDNGGGVNIGPVGFTDDGQTIDRFHRTWHSGGNRICR